MAARADVRHGFHWGAAAAAYQVEGASGRDERGAVLWDAFLAEGGAARGDDALVAADHLAHLEADLDLLVELGATAHRFSVAWARVMPDGRTPSARGLDVYRRLVDGLLERGIEPAVTLYHNDPPVAATGPGGWTERDVAARFADYAATVAGALGDRVTWWMTVNEPFYEASLGYREAAWPPRLATHATFAAALHHLLLGHGLAAQAIRASAAAAPAIGLVNSHSPCVAVRDDEADRRVAARVDAHTNRLVLDPVLRGAYPSGLDERLDDALAAVVRDGDLAVIGAPLDFLGLNYYHRRHLADASAANDPALFRRAVPAADAYPLTSIHELGAIELVPRDAAVSLMGAAIEPDGLREALLDVTQRYGPLRLFVTETGLPAIDYLPPSGAIDDGERIAFLDGAIDAIDEARAAGADVGGIFVWSLLDNLEWNLGYGPRFGLVYVEFASQRRVPKRSFTWYRDRIAGRRAPATARARPITHGQSEERNRP